MVKILAISDVHGEENENLYTYLNNNDIDLVLILGDITDLFRVTVTLMEFVTLLMMLHSVFTTISLLMVMRYYLVLADLIQPHSTLQGKWMMIKSTDRYMTC